MTRSEWIVSLFKAWEDNPCPHCGYSHHVSEVDEDGNLWMWCERAQKDFWVAHEHEPAHFDPEPAQPADLPF
jgi:hypothetical protein